MRKYVLIVVLAAVLSCGSISYAAVPVTRTDAWLERAMQRVQAEMENWIKNKLTSLANVNSVRDLTNLPGRLEGLTKNLDIQGVLNSMTGTLAEKARREMSKNTVSTMDEIDNDFLPGVDFSRALTDTKNFTAGLQNVLQDKIKAAIDKSVATTVKDFKETKENLDKEGYVILEPGETPDPDEKRPQYTAAEIEATGKVATQSYKNSMKAVTDATPAVMPGYKQKLVEVALMGVSNTTEREALTLNMVEQEKLAPVYKIAELTAKYEDKKTAAYRPATTKALEEGQRIAESVNTDFSSATEGAALKAIAGLSAATVQLLAMQNAILAEDIDVTADSIRLAGIQALMETESYGDSIQNNMDRYIGLYDKARLRFEN